MTTLDVKSLDIFKAVKNRKNRWAMWKITDLKIINAETSNGYKTANALDFLKALPDTECRYAVYDFEYKTKDGRQTDKLFFIFWTPPNCNQENRVVYSQAKQYILKELTGVENHSCQNRADVAALLKEECIGGKFTVEQGGDDSGAESEEDFD
eukprot:gb/GEZN01026423.1/.p1 GENE.gb/GEZN01026423.1/~~gb/GEZN01026423.1/.p1  ORF type:complete len:153 (+),score=32.96 gb/GEZN01026423.1/:20-478(+)